jgi:hypothetical protein
MKRKEKEAGIDYEGSEKEDEESDDCSQGDS